MEKIVIFGASGHAKVLVDILELMQNVTVVGFVDSYKKSGDLVYGYEILGSETVLENLVGNVKGLKGIIGIGDNWSRKRMFDKINQIVPRFEFMNAIHPNATLSPHAQVGIGNVFMAGSIVNPGAQIGDFCIVNTKASVGHDCILKDYSSVGPGATLGGNVELGFLSNISLGALVKNKVTIGNNSIVGAGSLLLENLGDHAVAYGHPAKFIRNREPGEPYL